MGKACSIHGRLRNGYKTSVEKPEGKMDTRKTDVVRRVLLK
jgi:hypothetical protein